MNQILKGEWGFDGFVEGDWTAVAELRACPPKNPDTGPCGHGVAADGPDAAALALNSGVDSEMTSTLIRDFGAAAARPGPHLDAADRRRGAAGSCASSSAPACSSTRMRPSSPTRPRPRC